MCGAGERVVVGASRKCADGQPPSGHRLSAATSTNDSQLLRECPRLLSGCDAGGRGVPWIARKNIDDSVDTRDYLLEMGEWPTFQRVAVATGVAHAVCLLVLLLRVGFRWYYMRI